MTDFTDLSFITDQLTQYFTGDRIVLALFIMFVFFIAFIARGVPPEMSLILLLPLAGFFLAIGYFGVVTNAQWIVNIILVGVGAIYGWAVIKLMS